MAILTAVQQEEVILGGVSEVGEFRIRNSAKAFSILSSGLYANKIKAIVRELSTNAVDSHFAAGKQGTPFDVHLPNAMEAWFAIRDYGTGLDHEQVTQIYTTYFESTKTGSNDFVGALGLGSKSPFAYTDNFTVTAIKDGVKRIYSAFINPQGVPSIAKMGEEATTEPSGVEIKFSVNDQWEYSKFRDEAVNVYKYFTLRPVVSGSAEFQFTDIEYDIKDIVPGVHSMRRGSRSVAVMGNIAYPIEIPGAQHKELGGLNSLLECGLEMQFDIGELDFQASREGLSYIPQTINAIKAKLSGINDQLAIRLGEEADKIENLWARAVFLLERKERGLWREAVAKYVADTGFDMLTMSGSNNYLYGKVFELEVNEMATKYNIQLDMFNKYSYSKTAQTVSTQSTHNLGVVTRYWEVVVKEGMVFVKNDLKTGAVARAKYHFNNTKMEGNGVTAVVISKVDKTKDADFDGFLAALSNPHRVLVASELLEKARKTSTGSGEAVTILELESKSSRSWGGSREWVWTNAGKASGFDKNAVHVYIPLSGYNSLLPSVPDVKALADDLSTAGVNGLKNVRIYGVRKTDLAWVQKQKNWVQADKFITKALKAVQQQDLDAMAKNSIDIPRSFKYNSIVVEKLTPQSPFRVLVEKFKAVDKVTFNPSSLNRLLSKFSNKKVDFEGVVAEFKKSVETAKARYPLLAHIDHYTSETLIADYINLIDTTKGI